MKKSERTFKFTLFILLMIKCILQIIIQYFYSGRVSIKLLCFQRSGSFSLWNFQGYHTSLAFICLYISAQLIFCRGILIFVKLYYILSQNSTLDPTNHFFLETKLTRLKTTTTKKKWHKKEKKDVQKKAAYTHLSTAGIDSGVK